MPEKKQTEAKIRSVRLTVETEGQRIDRFLGDHLRQFSRTRLETFFDGQRVFLNGQSCKKSEKVHRGDLVSLDIPIQTEASVPDPDPDLLEELFPLFEDDWYIAVHKPGRISVHPGSGEREFTVADYFRNRFPQEATQFSDPERPGIVHRLDKDTSGILLLAKTPEAAALMQAEFHDRRVDKTYLAWVEGTIKAPFLRLSAPIIRHPRQRIRYTTARPGTPGARDALTETRLLAVRCGKSLLRIRLFTGRTHQIRVHLSSIGHPVCGDRLYGSRTSLAGMTDSGIMLHAHQLSFLHPYTGYRVDLFSIMPPRMHTFWHKLNPVCHNPGNGL